MCKGPGCEDDWPATRVAIHRGAGLVDGVRDVWDAAEGSFDGHADDGAPWSVDVVRGQLVLGHPDAYRVTMADDRVTGGSFEPTRSWQGDDPGARFGASVIADDIDGSGGFDLWVTAPERDDARGAAMLFRDALGAGQPSLTIVGSTPGDRVGETIALCDDLTGDGLPELALAAPWFAATDRLPDVPDLAGAVILVESERIADRVGTVDVDEVGRIWWGDLPGDGAGHAIVCDADLTADGISDVAIGAPWADGLGGRVYVVPGRPLAPDGPLGEAADRILTARDGGEWFGAALSTQELDGVAPSELAVGAPGFDGGKGRVHLFAGQDLADALVPKPLATVLSDPSRDEADHIGRWLASGDLDGDGIDDVVIGAPDYRVGATFDTGRAWVLRGSGIDDWPLTFDVADADVTVSGGEPFQRVGRDPVIDDLDADGFGDLIFATRLDPELTVTEDE